jgi:signal transduction histidine kinase
VAAAAFALVLLATALLASRTLRERDAAVREGVLVKAAHALETRLRESTPEEVGAALESFLRENAASLVSVELLGPFGSVARAGESVPPELAAAGSTVEVPAGLGRAWRALAFGSGSGEGQGPGAGPGAGPGPFGRGLGRGPGGAGGPPFRLRLTPRASLGRASGLATAVLAGGVASAVALVSLAFVAARGLAERQRREAAEAEARRLQTVARAGAGLAHRLRNPLSVVKGTAQLLVDRVPAAERERVERIVDASVRLETILTRLLEFARPPSPQATAFDVLALAREVASRLGANGGPSRVEVTGAGEGLTARADREHVESILEELLANARAFDPEGKLEVAVRRAGESVVVEVADRGPGLQIEAARAFEPYVTSRPDGTGLGLAIVAALAAANGGTAAIASREGGGCVASLALPALAPPAES